jgi:hypothetical protein
MGIGGKRSALARIEKIKSSLFYPNPDEPEPNRKKKERESRSKRKG